MNINLDSAAIREATKAAVLNTLTGPEKDKLLAQAVESLLRESTQHGRASPIETAFQNAVNLAVHDLAKGYVEGNQEIKDKLLALLQAAAMKMLDHANVDKLVDKMADAFTTSLKDRY